MSHTVVACNCYCVVLCRFLNWGQRGAGLWRRVVACRLRGCCGSDWIALLQVVMSRMSRLSFRTKTLN